MKENRERGQRIKLMTFASAFCYRRESGCHATRRYHGPEGDLYLYRCDITIIVLKVTVMTPVHFGPAIRMVLIFSFPYGDSCTRNVLSKRLETLGIRPSVPFRTPKCHEIAANHIDEDIYRYSHAKCKYVCVRGNDGDIIRIRFDRGLNFWTSSFTMKHRVSQFRRTARRRISVSTEHFRASLEKLD